MAREIFQDTMTQAGADDNLLRALDGIEITVYPGGTVVGGTPSEDPVPIYQSRTGGAQGPAPEAAASGGPNPFVTGLTGAVEFWLESGFYDIYIRDSHVPARIPTRVLQWNAVAAVEGGIPGSWIGRPVGDAGVDIDALGDSALRQQVQIGQVIQWWRPNSSVPLPDGFEPADGATISEDQHDFPVVGPVTLPNLKNKFILGADHTIADATVGPGADGAGVAPGIRGAGGANQVVLTTAQLAAHNHTVNASGTGVSVNGAGTGISATGGDHTHTMGGGGGSFAVFDGTRGWMDPAGGGGGVFVPFTTGYHAFSGMGTDAANAGVGISDPGHGHGVSDPTHAHTTVNKGNDAAHSNVPAYYGLLMLIKVRRA